MKLSKLSLALMIAGGLTGCNQDNLSKNFYSNDVEIIEAQGNERTLNGKAVKGPLQFATVVAYQIDDTKADLKGTKVSQEGATDNTASIVNMNLDPANAPYILVVKANDKTLDMFTGKAPVITELRTIVTADDLNNDTPIFATPMTTLAVDIAIDDVVVNSTDLTQALAEAQISVKSTLGFGLSDLDGTNSAVDLFKTSPVLTDDTISDASQEATAAYRRAVEAVSSIAYNNRTDGTVSADQVINAIAKDLKDGVLDGKDGASELTDLAGKDIASTDINTLIIPGSTTKVIEVGKVLSSDTAKTKTNTELSDTFEAPAVKAIVKAQDTDNDGIPDVSYVDGNNVTIAADNCVDVKNANQIDLNGNGIGQVCDAAPMVENITVVTDEDTPVTITLLGSDANTDTLTYTVDGMELAAGVNEYVYTPAPNANGTFTLTYSATDGDNTSTTGTITINVTPVDDIATGSITIQGTAQVGSTLTVVNTLVDIDGDMSDITYEWLANGDVIVGETGSTLVLTNALANAAISLRVNYNAGDFTNAPVLSAATTEVIADTPTQGTASLSGTFAEDETITVTNNYSDVDGDVSVTGYAWYAGDTLIANATGMSYTLTQAEVGKTIKVDVTYQDSQFNNPATETITADIAVTNVNDLPENMVSVLLNGQVVTENVDIGDVLTASLASVIDDDGMTNPSPTYQWYIGDEPVLDATNETFTVTQSAGNKAVKVNVAYTDDFDEQEEVTSSMINVNAEPILGVAVTLEYNGAPIDGPIAINQHDDLMPLIANVEMSEGDDTHNVTWTITTDNGNENNVSIDANGNITFKERFTDNVTFKATSIENTSLNESVTFNVTEHENLLFGEKHNADFEIGDVNTTAPWTPANSSISLVNDPVLGTGKVLKVMGNAGVAKPSGFRVDSSFGFPNYSELSAAGATGAEVKLRVRIEPSTIIEGAETVSQALKLEVFAWPDAGESNAGKGERMYKSSSMLNNDHGAVWQELTFELSSNGPHGSKGPQFTIQAQQNSGQDGTEYVYYVDDISWVFTYPE